MSTICGANCAECGIKASCDGCVATDGHPFGGDCLAAECFKRGGEAGFCACTTQLTEEFNALGVPGLPPVRELFPLCGAFVNMEYSLPNGQRVKLLKDTDIYLGCQVEKPGSTRCYGLAADAQHLLVCEYGENGSDPEIVVYQKRM